MCLTKAMREEFGHMRRGDRLAIVFLLIACVGLVVPSILYAQRSIETLQTIQDQVLGRLARAEDNLGALQQLTAVDHNRLTRIETMMNAIIGVLVLNLGAHLFQIWKFSSRGDESHEP